MKKGFFWLALGLLLGGGTLLVWRLVFPSEKVLIGRTLEALERVCNVNGNESALVKAGRAQRLERLFAPQCQVAVDTYDYGKLVFSTRDELVQAALAVSFLQDGVSVKFPQTGITVGGSKTNAVAEIAATLSTRQRRGETLLLLKLFLEKDESRWRITRVESIKSLQM